MGVGNIKYKLLFVVLILILSASFVSGSIEISEDENKVFVDVDYARFSDDDQDFILQTGEIAISNTGNEEVSITLEAEGLPADYVLQDTSGTIAPNSTESITFTMNVTHSLDGGEEKIGVLHVKDAAGNTQGTIDLFQRTENMFELEKFKVAYTTLENKAERDTFDQGDDSFELDKEIIPGTEVTFTIELKNLFDQDYDSDKTDLRDVTIKLEVDDDDLFEDDFDDEYDFSDIEADEKDTKTVSFVVSDEADSTTYEFEITIEAEDDEGPKYKLERKLTLEVKREKDDVRVESVKFLPAKVTTCDSSFKVDVEIKNFGSRKQRLTAFSLANSELSVAENVVKILLEDFADEDENFWTKTFEYTFPQKLKKGTYEFDAMVFIDDDELMDHEIPKLVVEDCAATGSNDSDDSSEESSSDNGTETENETSDSESTTGAPSSGSSSSGGVSSTTDSNGNLVIRTVEDPYSVEDIIIGFMIVSVVLIIALIIALFVKLLR
tara:strand:+ start:247 stop:1731 length:1485 start_codon:yes stop_codon:yes gene_type:complete